MSCGHGCGCEDQSTDLQAQVRLGGYFNAVADDWTLAQSLGDTCEGKLLKGIVADVVERLPERLTAYLMCRVGIQHEAESTLRERALQCTLDFVTCLMRGGDRQTCVSRLVACLIVRPGGLEPVAPTPPAPEPPVTPQPPAPGGLPDMQTYGGRRC